MVEASLHSAESVDPLLHQDLQMRAVSLASTAHSLPAANLTALLEANETTGLSAEEAEARLALFGKNELLDAGGKSALALLLAQFANPLLIILLAGAIISFFTGHLVDAIAIAAIAVINGLISFFQEFQAEKSMAALNQMAAPYAIVRRDNLWKDMPAADLVPGDFVRLKAGDIVPADMRVWESARLQVEEAALTGESEPVDKSEEDIIAEDAVLADRTTMLFSSTQVTQGTAIALVTATGMSTEVGHIANLMAQTEEPQTPLQRRMASLSRILIGAALTVVALVIAIGLFNGMDAMEMFNTAISLSVAAIPEGLPTIVTIVLTIGSKAMARQNALTRQLASVETLGTTSVICTDKTGTLTQNQMQVMRTWAGGHTYRVTGKGFDPHGTFLNGSDTEIQPAQTPDLLSTLTVSVLCNEADLVTTDGRPGIQGNPTEGALAVAGAKAGLARDQLLAAGVQVLARFPFDSRRKMMSIHVRLPHGHEVLMAKGAPDMIVAHATHIRLKGEDIPLTDHLRQEIGETIRAFGSDALRTLAIAEREVEGYDLDPDSPEEDLVLLGIHGIMDPPRAEVKPAVEEATSAGMRTIMITGDHALTAQAIARQIGIITSPEQTVHTGAELDGMTEEDLRQVVPTAAVFARVTPEHKLRIVSAFQDSGAIAAMTGDGVNDAPALRKADIGIAMGITGTSVAKSSASLILLDDNFSTIVTAVREGRRIYDNLRKFIRQALTANVAEVSTILFAFVLMGSDPLLPLTPLMILWVNLVSDGIPALTLGFEPEEADLMQRPPRAKDESIFAENLKQRILTRGLAVGAVSFLIFFTLLKQGHTLPYAQTAAFATLIFAQLWHIFDARTTRSLFSRNPLQNRHLLVAVAGSLVLSLLAIYTSPGHYILNTAPLPLKLLVECFFLGALPTLILSGVREIFGLRFV